METEAIEQVRQYMYAADQAKTETEDYRQALNKMRNALQEIFAQRGEDQLIAEICGPLIDQYRDW